MYFAVVEVTQRGSTINAEPTTVTLQVPEDGNVHVKFKLRDQVETLFIRVSFLVYSSRNFDPPGKAVCSSFAV